MSHEVRTPLHGILGLARLLRSGLPQAETGSRRQHLQTLERTGEHLLHVINDVLDYSKIESQHLRLQPQAIDLHALVADAADLCRPAAQEKGLRLDVEQALPQPCMVLADPARLRQVLLNLLGNAIKFTDQGRVTLHSGRRADGVLELAVTDTGPGVPAADRERVFNPFEQLDGSFSRQHGGTGLGLSISRELVRAMGGELDCGVAPEGGAGFRVSLALPAAVRTPGHEPGSASAFAGAGPAEAEAPVTACTGRVLLVEDNPVNAIVAEAWLQRHGVDVTTVADGVQAVERATTEVFDLILMDCQMPGIDGFEATARIRRHERQSGHPARPIVALTANALQGDRERSLAAGMDEHLAKPFNEAELRAVLLRHLPQRTGLPGSPS
jgi:CheY-like chemotaxis protein/anti-sigma regulatory factor (Ser/Thr protein kinase)